MKKKISIKDIMGNGPPVKLLKIAEEPDQDVSHLTNILQEETKLDIPNGREPIPADDLETVKDSDGEQDKIDHEDFFRGGNDPREFIEETPVERPDDPVDVAKRELGKWQFCLKEVKEVKNWDVHFVANAFSPRNILNEHFLSFSSFVVVDFQINKVNFKPGGEFVAKVIASTDQGRPFSTLVMVPLSTLELEDDGSISFSISAVTENPTSASQVKFTVELFYKDSVGSFLISQRKLELLG